MVFKKATLQYALFELVKDIIYGITKKKVATTLSDLRKVFDLVTQKFAK